MDLVLLCVICGGENGTKGCHLAVFIEDIAFSLHFVATHPPPTLAPCRSGSSIGYTSKYSLKWWAIRLAIHTIVGEYIDSLQIAIEPWQISCK